MRSFIVAAAITTTVLFSQGQAKSAEIKILSVVPLKTSLDELGPQFERATGHKLIVEYDGSSQLKRRLEAGEAFDIALIYPELINQLVKQGRPGAQTQPLPALPSQWPSRKGRRGPTSARSMHLSTLCSVPNRFPTQPMAAVASTSRICSIALASLRR